MVGTVQIVKDPKVLTGMSFDINDDSFTNFASLVTGQVFWLF